MGFIYINSFDVNASHVGDSCWDDAGVALLRILARDNEIAMRFFLSGRRQDNAPTKRKNVWKKVNLFKYISRCNSADPAKGILSGRPRT